MVLLLLLLSDRRLIELLTLEGGDLSLSALPRQSCRDHLRHWMLLEVVRRPRQLLQVR